MRAIGPNPRTRPVGGVCALLLSLCACASDPASGGAVTEGGAQAGSTATSNTRAGTFTEVYEMLFPRATNAHCDMCHGLPPYDLSNGNLSTGMDKASTYAALVGKASTSSMCKDKILVVPKQPESSLLLEKLLPDPSCGFRMPNGGAALSESQLELVRSWIAVGAPDD